jgi:hypothetical protein
MKVIEIAYMGKCDILERKTADWKTRKEWADNFDKDF